MCDKNENRESPLVICWFRLLNFRVAIGTMVRVRWCFHGDNRRILVDLLKLESLESLSESIIKLLLVARIVFPRGQELSADGMAHKKVLQCFKCPVAVPKGHMSDTRNQR